jgi:hypothetical protein
LIRFERRWSARVKLMIYITVSPRALHARAFQNQAVVAEFNEPPLIALKQNSILGVGKKAEDFFGKQSEQIFVCNPFSHSRLAFHDQEVAGSLLRVIIGKVYSEGNYLRPKIAIHPLYPFAITDVEESAFFNLLIQAGARAAMVVKSSEPLEEKDILNLKFGAKKSPPTTTPSSCLTSIETQISAPGN